LWQRTACRALRILHQALKSRNQFGNDLGDVMLAGNFSGLGDDEIGAVGKIAPKIGGRRR
jgi:hypothetical protein